MNALHKFSLAGKRALITGSSRGIGRALAEGLAGAGAEILLNGRDPHALGAVAANMAETGIKVRALAFDVTSPENVAEAISYAESEIGPIDILINNAGITYRTPLEDFPPERFDAIMRTNVNAPFYVGQQVARHMIARRAGKIINTCSVMTSLARPGIAPYTASKGAVGNLTKGMATDWARYGLNVNGIAPGYFRTELNKALYEDEKFNTWIEGRTPMGRWGEVEELVGAAIFLSSEASSFINGQVIYVDGGITASV